MKSSVEAALVEVGLDPAWVGDLVARTLAEDLGERGDVTSRATVRGKQHGTGEVVARAAGVLAGVPVALAVLDAVVPQARVAVARRDGDRLTRDDVILQIEGPVRGMLSAERSLLNLLSRASGVATATRAWADALAGTGATVLDTRKTTPGLRALEKYAVRVGGGANKRFGLYDVAMIKDNHVIAAGGVVPAYQAVRERWPDLEVQVEVTTVEMAVEAVAAGATFLLCDNMSPKKLRKVVAAVGGGIELEATGGLTLDRAREFGETGVDYLSVGALTHSAPIVDLALDLRPDHDD